MDMMPVTVADYLVAVYFGMALHVIVSAAF